MFICCCIVEETQQGKKSEIIKWHVKRRSQLFRPWLRKAKTMSALHKEVLFGCFPAQICSGGVSKWEIKTQKGGQLPWAWESENFSTGFAKTIATALNYTCDQSTKPRFLCFKEWATLVSKYLLCLLSLQINALSMFVW